MALSVSPSNCLLRIPHKSLSDADPEYAKKAEENWLALEQWATYFHQNCAGRRTFGVAATFGGLLREVTSPPRKFHVPATLTRVDVDLGTAGSSSTIVKWYKNGGTALGTITLTSSDSSESATGLSTSFAAYSDLLTVEIDTAGVDAESMGVLFTFAYA